MGISETTGIYNNSNRTRFINELESLDQFDKTVEDIMKLASFQFPDSNALLEICNNDHVRYYGDPKPYDHIPREYTIGSYLFNRETEPTLIQDTSEDKHLSNNPFLGSVKSIYGVPLMHQDGFVYGSILLLSKNELQVKDEEKRFLENLTLLIDKTLHQLLALYRATSLVHHVDQDSQRFYNMVEKSSNIIYELDTHGQYLYVNNAFLHHIGYNKEEILEMHYWDVVHPDYRDKVIRFYGNQIKNSSWSSYYEFPVIKKNGETSWLGISTQMIYEHDKLKNIYASATDINERKWIENNLIQSNEDLNALIDSSENIVFVINKDLKFEKVFCRFEDYLDQPKRKFVGKHVTEMWTDKPNGLIMCGLAEEAIKTGETLIHEYKYAPQGKEYYWEARFNCYKGFDEKLKLSVIISNISERKEYEEKIRVSEEQYRLLSENSSDLVCLHDKKGKFQFVSQSIKELLGYTSKELIGQHPFNFIHPEDIDKIKESPVMTRISVEQVINVPYRFRKKNGEYLWLQAFTRPVRDKKGRFTGFQSSSRDISRNKQDEEKLEKYTEGLKFLNQLTSTSTLTTSQRIETALFTALEFFDLEVGILSEINGNEYKIIYNYALNEDQELQNGDIQPFDSTYCHITYHSSDIFYTHEMKRSPHSGHPCYSAQKIESYIGASYYVSRQKKGTINFTARNKREPFNSYEVDFMKLLAIWIGFLLERDQWESTIKAEQRVLQAFVETAPAAIAMLNTDLEYIAVSERWKRDNSIENEPVIGEKVFDDSTKNSLGWLSVYEEVLQGKVKKKDEQKFINEDGTSRWIKWEVRPWYTLNDEIGGLITFTENITQLKEQQLLLIEARDTAEKANKVKEQFYSTISHEIRTPLNAVIGMANLLLLEDHLPKQFKKLELLKNSGQNLMMLINDVLDFNKMESGKIELSSSSFDLRKLASDIVEIFKPKADENGIYLKLNFQEELPQAYVGDSLRIGQVLNNLISNAIKFTTEGGVTLTISGHESDNQYRLKFEVKDTGIGIPEDKLQSIFQDFSQASNDITQKYGGTGLGLTISNKLIQLMKSEIQVKSIEDLGSSFYFFLDLEKGDEDVVVNSSMAESFQHFTEDKKILIAEDNMGNQAVIESFMEIWELDFDFANNGQEAVDMVKSKAYNLILMDLRMPVKDGYEATKEIRAMEDPYFKNIPIIALTASALNNVQESTKEAGMNECVIKPFSPNELNAVINKYINRNVTQIDCNEETSENKTIADMFPYVASLVNGKEEAIIRILSATAKSVLEAVKGCEEAVKTSDPEKLSKHLHTLRPNLHSLGIDNLLLTLPEDTIGTADKSLLVFDEIKEKTNFILETYGND